MELKTLKDLLSIQEEELSRYDVDQLRLLLGVSRYFVRKVEREINQREAPHNRDLSYI